MAAITSAFLARWDRVFHSASGELGVIVLSTTLLSLLLPVFLAHPLFAIGGLGLVVLVPTVLLRPRVAFFLAIAGLVLMEEFDLSSSEAFFEAGINNSLLALRVFGVSFMDILTLLFLLPVLVREWDQWYRTGRLRALPTDRFFLPMLLVYLMGAFQGWFTKLSFSHFTWEARDILYILAWYIVASRTLKGGKDVRTLILLVLSVFSVKSLLFVYRALMGQGLFYGYDYYRVALGSDVPMMALPFVASLVALVILRARPWWQRGLLALFALWWTVLLLASLGRSAYLLTALSLVVTVVAFRRDIRPKHLALGAGGLLVGGSIFYWGILGPVHRELVSYVLGSAFNWVDALSVYGDLSIGQRVMEAINISETLNRAQAWILGMGWGSSWTELVIKHPIDKGSFPLEEQLSGIHTSAHIDALYFLMKVGVLGTLVLYGSYLRFFRRILRHLTRETDVAARLVSLVLLVFLVMVVPNYVYFVKLKCLLGVVLGCVGLLEGSSDFPTSSEHRELVGPAFRVENGSDGNGSRT